MLALYWLALTGITAVSIAACAVRREEGRARLEFTPRLLLPLSYYFYASALAVSRVAFCTPGESSDAAYLVPHLLGALGITLGVANWRHVARRQRPAAFMEGHTVRGWMLLAALGAGVWFQVWVVFQQVEGGLLGLLSPYALGEGFSPGGLLGSLVVVSSNIAIATILVAHPVLKQRGRLRLAVLLAVALLSMLFAVRGNRNMLGFLVLPLAGLYLRGRGIRVRNLLLVVGVAYVTLYGIGVVRNYGFARFFAAANTVPLRDVANPLAGEFGTSYSVFSRWLQLPMRRESALGATYTRDVLLNLVPRQFWPDRPATAAVAFSMDYYRTKRLEFGLGFSPTVEALWNFGVVGVLPMFALFGWLLRKIEDWSETGSAAGILVYAYAFPAVMNWNRIDMATNVKMFLVSAGIAWVLHLPTYRRGPAVARGLRPAVA